jgi:hypothetical protein
MVVGLGFVVRPKPALHRYIINATMPKMFIFGIVGGSNVPVEQL